MSRSERVRDFRDGAQRLPVDCRLGGRVSYFAVAGMNALPHRTTGEKKVVLVIAVAILLLFGVLLVWLVRLWHERRRVTKEWKQRAAQLPADPSDTTSTTS
jgi:cell division protein FtsX